MNLSEMFQSEVVTVDPEASVECAVHKMKHDNVGAVVVIDDGNVVGIVTDRDIACKLGTNEAKPGTPVNEIMSKDVVTIWDDQGVFNATQYMVGHKIRRLPIIDRSNHLVGMVTSDDLFVLLARELLNVAKAIEPALAMKSF
jgi:IMP dehydrogenase